MDPWLSPTCHVFQPRESRPSDVGVQAIFKWDRDSKAYGAGGCSMYTVYTTYYIQVYIYILGCWVSWEKKGNSFFCFAGPWARKAALFCAPATTLSWSGVNLSWSQEPGMASGGSDNWTYDFWIVHHWHLTNMHSNPNDACSVAELKSFLHLKLSSHICCRPSISCRPPICFDPSSDPEAMLNGKPVLFFLNWNLIARDLLRKPHINLSWSFGASQESAEDLYFCVIKGCSKSVGTKKSSIQSPPGCGPPFRSGGTSVQALVLAVCDVAFGRYWQRSSTSRQSPQIGDLFHLATVRNGNRAHFSKHTPLHPFSLWLHLASACSLWAPNIRQGPKLAAWLLCKKSSGDEDQLREPGQLNYKSKGPTKSQKNMVFSVIFMTWWGPFGRVYLAGSIWWGLFGEVYLVGYIWRKLFKQRV